MKKIFAYSSIFAHLVLMVGCGTALMQAAGRGEINTVKALLDQGANVNESIMDGSTALTMASGGGHIEVVKILLDKGANVNAPYYGSLTALSAAVRAGHTDIAKLLIDRGADIDYAIRLAWAGRYNLGVGNANHIIELLKELKQEKASTPPRTVATVAPSSMSIAGETKKEAPRPESISSASLAIGKDRPKFAVWDLTPLNINRDYAQALTSILVSEISKLDNNEVYSQENVRTLAGWTAERMQLGCTDSKCLTALGQMDVAKLISGSVGKIGNTYTISLNLFDTQNAKAEKAVSEFCRTEDELISLIQQAVRKLLSVALK